MNPKEKARELVDRFLNTIIDNPTESNIKRYWNETKQCALICVDEIIEVYWGESYSGNNPKGLEFWQQVKTEIKKL